MSMTSRAPSTGPAAYPKANRESATGKAADWHAAKTRGERLPVHAIACDLPCPFCGEPMDLDVQPSEDGPVTVGVCARCITVCEVSLP